MINFNCFDDWTIVIDELSTINDYDILDYNNNSQLKYFLLEKTKHHVYHDANLNYILATPWTHISGLKIKDHIQLRQDVLLKKGCYCTKLGYLINKKSSEVTLICQSTDADVQLFLLSYLPYLTPDQLEILFTHICGTLNVDVMLFIITCLSVYYNQLKNSLTSKTHMLIISECLRLLDFFDNIRSFDAMTNIFAFSPEKRNLALRTLYRVICDYGRLAPNILAPHISAFIDHFLTYCVPNDTNILIELVCTYPTAETFFTFIKLINRSKDFIALADFDIIDDALMPIQLGLDDVNAIVLFLRETPEIHHRIRRILEQKIELNEKQSLFI